MSRHDHHPDDTEAAQRLKQFLADVLFETRLRPVDAAAKLNISSGRLYRYLNPQAGENNLPAYLLPLWTTMIGAELLMQLAHEAGYTVVPLPPGPPTVTDAIQAAALAMHECGEALTAFTAGASQQHFSAMAIRNLQQKLQVALSRLAALEYVADGLRVPQDREIATA